MKCIEVELQKANHAGALAYYHPHWTRTTAPLLDELGAVLDHKTPFSAGGSCSDENLVTSCAKCNGRKSSASQDKWGQREIRKPIKAKFGEPQEWDGLSNFFVLLAERNISSLTAGERAWLKALNMQDKSQLYSLGFDVSEISKQASEMAELLNNTSFPEGFPSDLTTALFDVVLSDAGAALSTDGTKQVLIRLNFGSRFEQFMAALRTGKPDDVIHDVSFAFRASSAKD